MSQPVWLRIEGARQNNLKNVSVDIPHDRVTVVTGVSGSGKSSLAFDTLFAEGQWRYIESLSTYARMFLERLDRPDVDRIEHIRPAIALARTARLCPHPSRSHRRGMRPPFDRMADSPIAKWLLYRTDTPVLDWLTDDSNLHAIQLGAAGVAVGALTVATGGAAGSLAAGSLGGAGLSAAETAVVSGAVSGVAGGIEFRSGVAALAYADTSLLNVGTPGPQLDADTAVGYVFDPQAISTDAAWGGAFGVMEYAAPLIGRGVAQLMADTEGSINLGGTPGGPLPGGEVPSASGDLPGADTPGSSVGTDLPTALSDGPWRGGSGGPAQQRRYTFLVTPKAIRFLWNGGPKTDLKVQTCLSRYLKQRGAHIPSLGGRSVKRPAKYIGSPRNFQASHGQKSTESTPQPKSLTGAVMAVATIPTRMCTATTLTEL